MIGAIIGGALALGSSIYGGIAGARANRKARRALQDQREKNQAWYDRRYNEDATQRADAQALLTRTEQMLRNRAKSAAATQALMGGTEASAAAERAAANRAMADTVSNVVASGEARKDAIEQQYMQADQQLAQGQMQMDLKRQQGIAQAVQGAGAAAASIATSLGDDELINNKGRKATSGM